MPFRFIIMAVAANLISGTAYLATDYLLKREFSRGQAGIVRLAVSAVFLIPVMLRTLRSYSRADHVTFFIIAGISIYIPTMLSVRGLELSTTVNASLVLASEPVYIVLLAWMFLREPLTPGKTAGVVLGMLGIVFIVLQGVPGYNASLSLSRGDLLFLLAAVCWATYVVFLKRLKRQDDAMGTVAWICLYCTLMGAAAGDYNWPMLRAHDWTALDVFVMLHCSLGLMVLVCWCWNTILQHVESSRYAPYLFLQPVTGVALGALILGEAVTRWHLAGGACILLGIYLTTISASPIEQAAAVTSFQPVVEHDEIRKP